MAVYNDIINWSKKKPMFLRDAIRRLLKSSALTDSDLEEIKNLIKKENGFDGLQICPIPAQESDIPTISYADNPIKLLQIKSPHNMSALTDGHPLEFSTDRLTIIYGKNGSGKSSYSKILKKMCWSRDKDVVLKKNVYTGDTSSQSVIIEFLEGNNKVEFVWNEGQQSDKRLDSVFVFDSKCADIYLNKENPSEYKPAGIDILESLVAIFGELSRSFDNEILQLRRIKPQLLEQYKNTNLYNWYQNIEEQLRNDIYEKLVFSEEQKERKSVLEKALMNSNLSEANNNLKLKRQRYQALQKYLNGIETFFSQEAVESICKLNEDYLSKKQASILAKSSYETQSAFTIGGHAWKVLWNAAREYAIHELNVDYPIASSNDGAYCVLCHQHLDKEAKERLQKFDLFIQDRTSIELDKTKKNLDETIEKYVNIPNKLISDEIKNEIIEDDSRFKEEMEVYENQILKFKDIIVNYLSGKLDKISDNTVFSFSDVLEQEIAKIDQNIKANDEVINNREKTQKEFLELDALCHLVNDKDDIIHYFDEYKIKQKLNNCKNSLNTRAISSKIGELLESNAIQAQHRVFIDYLNRLNPKIAAKMELRKTKTTSGVTYQECCFTSIQERIIEVLSEGEQKIVAIANFLSECTIDNARNSIVLDDPVNSLDMDYRESIAKIIVELSQNRQVIVMTHDLYFLRLLSDIYKSAYSSECFITCLNAIEDNIGMVSDEIPFLAKNVQERIDTITSDLSLLRSIDISQVNKREIIINDLKDKMRQLLERTVEDVLVNNTITRFSKNINFKKGNLANMIVVEKGDIDFLLSLYGKYSLAIHDGSIETLPNAITESDIQSDLSLYKNWKDRFNQNVKEWKRINNY